MYRVFHVFLDALWQGAGSTSVRAALADVARVFVFPLLAYSSIPVEFNAAARAINGTVLNRREFEYLAWATRGKAASEVRRILGISPRLAAFHLDHARAKLGVKTRTQALPTPAALRSAGPSAKM